MVQRKQQGASFSLHLSPLDLLPGHLHPPRNPDMVGAGSTEPGSGWPEGQGRPALEKEVRLQIGKWEGSGAIRQGGRFIHRSVSGVPRLRVSESQNQSSLDLHCH